MTTTLIVIACLTVGAQQSAAPKAPARPKAAAATENIAGLVMAAPLPEGFTAKAVETKDGNKVLGHAVIVAKEGMQSKVVIQIEDRQIETREQKIAATKGYLNGLVQGFDAAGMTLLSKTIPSRLDNMNPERRQSYNLVYKTPAGPNIRIMIQIFFANNKGYQVQFVGQAKEGNAALSTWARTVREVR